MATFLKNSWGYFGLLCLLFLALLLVRPPVSDSSTPPEATRAPACYRHPFGGASNPERLACEPKRSLKSWKPELAQAEPFDFRSLVPRLQDAGTKAPFPRN